MKPNVLLVVLDSVRAKNVSAYGHHHETTPFLDRFADRATRYEQARSPGAKSLTSHTSLFTGLHVEEHGVTSTDHSIDPEYTVFADLRDQGYDTGVFSENTWITDVEVGLKDGFDTVVGPQNSPFPDVVNPKEFVAKEGRGQYGEYLKASLTSAAPVKSLLNGVAMKLAWDHPTLVPDFLKATTPADVYTDFFLDWQAERTGPWAACINLMDGHIPYEPRDEHDQWGGEKARAIQNETEDHKWEFNGGQRPWWQRKAVESLYDGAIRQMDAELERLLKTLEERGVLDETLVVITSDHGDGFGEPSFVRPNTRVSEHGVAIHETLFHVPLFVKSPGQTEGRTIEEPATLTEFPAAVRAAVDGTYRDGDEFVPDGPVLASAAGLTEPLKERASEYVDDLTPYTARSKAVYETHENEVRKHVTWRDQSATVGIRDAQTVYLSSRNDSASGTAVEAAFDGIDDAGVKADAGGVEEVDETTYQRLEDLGYV